MKKVAWAMRTALITAVLLFVACFTTACLPQTAPAAAPPATMPASTVPPQASATPQATSAVGDLNEAVSAAVLGKLWDDAFGEVRTEGHIILSTAQDKDDNTVVYAVASYCTYGFENGYFTVTSGGWTIPAVIKFTRDGAGYTLLSYKEPEDGSRNTASTKALFPQELWLKVLHTDQFASDLQKQMEAQAQTYLDGIGRDAQVHTEFVEKDLLHIQAEASNALIEIQQLNAYPYWIGSQETVENGSRFIYETAEEDLDGYSVITYTKKAADGTVVEQFQYKVTGGTVSLMQ